MPAKSGRTTMTKRTLLLLLPPLAAYGLVRAGSSSWASATPAHAPCPRSGVALQVDSAARVLSLCREGVEDGSFRVALGRGGLDKRSEGDGRTPRGAYPLQPGRASRRYHLFLPVGYPTAAQVRNGYSGSAIGVHGPHAAFAWLGHATAWPNWTLGCVAVGTRTEIERIARWVEANAAEEIVVL